MSHNFCIKINNFNRLLPEMTCAQKKLTVNYSKLILNSTKCFTRLINDSKCRTIGKDGNNDLKYNLTNT